MYCHASTEHWLTEHLMLQAAISANYVIEKCDNENVILKTSCMSTVCSVIGWKCSETKLTFFLVLWQGSQICNLAGFVITPKTHRDLQSFCLFLMWAPNRKYDMQLFSYNLIYLGSIVTLQKQSLSMYQTGAVSPNHKKVQALQHVKSAEKKCCKHSTIWPVALWNNAES